MSCLFRSCKHSCFTISVITLALLSFAFISCGNLFNPETQESSASGNGGVNSSNIVTFRGTVSNSGAVPSGIAANSSLSGSTRQSDNLLSSAMPVFNTTDYTYFATAKNAADTSESVNGTFANPAIPDFEIPLVTGKTWLVTCGIKNSSDEIVLVSEEKSFPLTNAAPVIDASEPFIVKPVEGGTGSIALQMTLADSVDSVKVLCNDSNFPSKDLICSSDFTLEINNIPSGSYEVTFIFLDGVAPSDPSELDTRTFLYSTTQSINVIKGMVTNTWHSDGTSLFTTSGSTTTFNLTDDIINSFLDTTIYVGQNSAATSVNVTASDINSGHAYNPLAHLQAAVDKIAAAGDSTKDYKIFVSGTVTGTTELTSALGTTNANKKAKLITLCGLTGLSGGVPQDVLDGNNAGSVLTVNTIVPVKIKNLKISGGNATNGGGLNMASASTVTLESGAVVGGTSGTTAAGGETTCSNYAEHGGGIYSEGNLTLKNGSSVIYNYGTDGGGICCNGGSLTINAGAKVNLNGTNSTGGGISITGSEFSMTGGEVCNNISTYGGAGGIYIGGTCPDLMTISGAEISGNTADEHGDAGGILYDGGEGKTLSITGNTIISGNHSKFEGGGIRIASGILDLSGGTISNNYSLVTDGRVGGVASIHQSILKISGSVYIPSGAVIDGEFINEPRCNGVRSNHNSIIIKGPITPPAQCSDGIIATVCPSSEAQGIRGAVVFVADDTNVTDLTPYKDCFALTNADDGWELKLSDDNKKLVLDSPIYVAGGETTRQVCTADGSASGDGSKSAPYDTIENAVNAIIALNAEVDYTIYVDGVISGHQTIPSSLTSDKASSLTIQGVSGNTNDILNGNNTTGSVLTINSAVPVTIKDLKITGGKDVDGAGIKAEAEGEGAYLVLDQGCLITENDAVSASGGGVNIIGGTLIMRGNAEISECHGTWGGGIRAQDSDASAIQTIVRLEGNASIKDCTGSEGGGIGLIGSRVFLYVKDNAEISGNTADTDGGGIRIFGSTANISGGVIKENKAVSAGGAVSVKNDGVLNLSGSIWIPEGVTAGGNLQKGSCKNDIYLADSRKVTIAGALTPPEDADGIVASITPQNWTRGLDLIEADDTHVTNLTSYKDNFALTNAADGWELKLSSDNTALKLDAPIYVKHGGSETAAGTKSNPFDSIDHALSVMTNKDFDYRIYIDGEVTDSCHLQDIKTDGSGTYNARTILITGANEIVSGSQRIDILKASAYTRVMLIHTEVPVTITNLKITGGNTTGYGGGIYQWPETTLTLGDDALIEGNHAGRDGTSDAGGVFVQSGATLKITGNAVVSGNTAGTNASDTHASNVYLGGGVITVTGPLVNSTDSTKKAKIGVSTATDPTLDTPVVFTSGYGYATGGYNAGVRPGTYFHGDKWGVKLGLAGAAGSGSPYEAALAASGGNITIDPIYEDIQISADKTSFAKDTASKVITFTAKGVNSEGQQVTLPIGTGEGKVSLTYSVSYHGETIPEESGSTSYYTTGTDTLTLRDALPLGEYTVSLTAIYNGKTYSASFEIAIGKYAALPSSYSDIESGKTYAVADSSAMEKLAEFSSYGYDFSGVTLKLSSDVTIDTTWTPVGNATAFRGTFDGDEKTVTFAAESNAEAFFGTVEGTVRNLKVAGSTSVAGIAKTANSSAVIENCESSATVTSSTTQDYCAGIVAAVLGNVTITGCVNTGAITSNVVLPADNYSYGAGGITGNVYNGGIIDSCKNTGNVTGPNAGGITGQVDSNSTIRNACNSGNITSTGLHAGGISAISQGNGGEINQASHIDNCFNSGSVTAEGTENVVYAGGIVGKHGWGNASWAQNCLNLGNVSISGSAKPGSHAGALFGLKDGWSRIDFCYYKEGCAGSNFGIGDSSDDTENECIKATQSGTNNAVITAGVTLNGTAYSADTSTVLSLLNAWVRANNTDGAYCEWETENHWPKLKIE